jgi:hypothetical protein
MLSSLTPCSERFGSPLRALAGGGFFGNPFEDVDLTAMSCHDPETNQVEKDFTVYGDECKFGGGKVLREGMGQATGFHAAQCLDLVITNALVVDHTGIFKVYPRIPLKRTPTFMPLIAFDSLRSRDCAI